LHHQAGNERNVARQPVELGDEYAALRGFRGCQRRPKLWPSIECIGALAGFGFNIFPGDGEALCFGKPRDGRPLRLRA
jgi:hypothetical protein